MLHLPERDEETWEPQRQPRIIAIFVNGHTIPSLPQDVAGHHALYSAMSDTYFSSGDRPGLYMTGLRCNIR